ncbi:GumC family protein [Mucilaginibacter sp. UC70_90]
MEIQNLQGGEPLDNDEKSFDFKAFFSRAIADWWLFLISFIVCVSLGVFFLKFKRPLYQIHASILVEDDKKGGDLSTSDVLGDLSGLLNTKSSVDNESQILQTRFLMEKVVRDMRLNVTYYSQGFLKNYELYKSPILVDPVRLKDTIMGTSVDLTIVNKNFMDISFDNDSTTGTIEKRVKFDQPFRIPGVGSIRIRRSDLAPVDSGDFTFKIVSIDNAVAKFMKDLTVAVPNKDVSTINLEIDHSIPRKGEDILNKYINVYQEENQNDKNQIADSTISFINERLIIVSRELSSVEGDIQLFKQKNSIADITEQSKALVANSTDYVNRLAQIETQLSMINALEDYLKDVKNERVLPSAIVPDDKIFAGLVDRYNTLVLERERQLLSYTSDNPQVINIDQRISSLRNDMLTNLASTRRSAIISRQDLQKSTGKIEGQIHAVPSQERQFMDLSRTQQIKQTLYTFLLQKREETAISKTSNISNSRVIDPPKSDVLPYSPKPALILGLSVFFALFDTNRPHICY